MVPSLESTIQDIRSLKIQGAEAISVSALYALNNICTWGGGRKCTYVNVIKAKKRLAATRPTEPCMRNAMRYVLYGLDETTFSKKVFAGRISDVLSFFKESGDKIAKYGRQTIKNKTVVFTHCHSSAVVNILICAKKAGEIFSVTNTEVRPRFQGRITAKELSKAGIFVKHYVDSGAKIALSESDVFLMGCDAITPKYIVNKIGSGMFSDIAVSQKVPVYVCTNSWKFDPLTLKSDEPIEQRPRVEVWKTPPKLTQVRNPAFEMVFNKNISGIITELGILKPKEFIKRMKKKQQWMFD